MMQSRNLSFLLAVLGGLFLASGCGKGSSFVSSVGYCDGYADPAQSLYKLPWNPGQTFKVSQGNCMPASHFGGQRYAYDIPMPIGTSVRAARDGDVIGVVQSNNDGSGCPYNNFINVKHGDGTVASYVHITRNGARASVGDSVVTGQEIALSGNAGCSTAPHLHFVVFQDGSLRESVPVTFWNAGSNPRGLQSDSAYTAYE